MKTSLSEGGFRRDALELNFVAGRESMGKDMFSLVERGVFYYGWQNDACFITVDVEYRPLKRRVWAVTKIKGKFETGNQKDEKDRCDKSKGMLRSHKVRFVDERKFVIKSEKKRV